MDNGGGRKAPERGRDRAEFEVAAVTAIRYCLRDMSIRREDAEYCEAEFVLKILRLIAREREPSGAAPRTAAADPAWLRRCAQNHAIDFLRAARRRRAREVSEEDGTWSEAQRALPAENPEARLLQREEADRDMAALRILNAGQRELFARRLHGESNAQIAAACGRTPHAIEQSLSNIRRRLRAALGRE